MSVDFPLILVLATGFTGGVWLLDCLLFRSKRREKLNDVGELNESER